MQLMGKDKGGRGGTVVVTSSTMGYKPCPSMPIYTATKHALIGFIRSFGVSIWMCDTIIQIIYTLRSPTRKIY